MLPCEERKALPMLMHRECQLDVPHCCVSFFMLTNKLVHILWLKTTERYSLTVLGTGSLKSSCRRDHTPS